MVLGFFPAEILFRELARENVTRVTVCCIVKSNSITHLSHAIGWDDKCLGFECARDKFFKDDCFCLFFWLSSAVQAFSKGTAF